MSPARSDYAVFLPSWWLNLSRAISMKAAVDSQSSQRMKLWWPPDFFSSAIIIVFKFQLVSRTLHEFKMALQTSHQKLINAQH